MLYIHHSSCISPQKSFGQKDLNHLNEVTDNQLRVAEPAYEGIPTGILRRMGKAVRIAVGAALPIMRKQDLNGIIIGTANGAMEDCIKFLNQIIDYEEGMLTPTNFVQSTPNAIAAQLGLLLKNRQYNITHVHRAQAFENAMLDAQMLLQEHPEHAYLVGGVDEISSYNYNIERLAGWYKKESITSRQLYASNTVASIAGEGAAMFVMKGVPQNAIAAISALQMLNTTNEETVAAALQHFLSHHLTANASVDLFLSGENGDSRLLKYYQATENIFSKPTNIARFKHMMGEFTTVSGMAVWLGTEILIQQQIPSHMLKSGFNNNPIQRILIYNNYKGYQHSFILLTKMRP
jgi:hypothetical protein